MRGAVISPWKQPEKRMVPGGRTGRLEMVTMPFRCRNEVKRPTCSKLAKAGDISSHCLVLESTCGQWYGGLHGRPVAYRTCSKQVMAGRASDRSSCAVSWAGWRRVVQCQSRPG